MNLAIQMWQDSSHIACDRLLQEMVDTLNGYLYGLLNSGDNDGRITWAPAGGASGAPGSNGYRMLDDIRLLTYPAEAQAAGSPLEVTVTIDCDLPYAQDETQIGPGVDGPQIDTTGVVVTNYGNRPTFPVWKLYGPFVTQTLTNTTTGDVFSYDANLPPGTTFLELTSGTDYLEIDTFHNTVTMNVGGVLSNAAAGVKMDTTVFGSLPPGDSNMVLSNPGSVADGLINGAWVS
jgi:hypothetical protein